MICTNWDMYVIRTKQTFDILLRKKARKLLDIIYHKNDLFIPRLGPTIKSSSPHHVSLNL